MAGHVHRGGPAGKILDHHDSHLTCSFPDDGSHDYYQVNRYTWADGRSEVHRFPGRYLGDGRMGFDTERIKGETWELDERAIYLHWIYQAEGTDLQLFELIVLSDDGMARSRVWQWIKEGICVQRTLINEKRVA
ncbi:hypothetical protein [Actinomadura sp. J1-007]|uniref:hypothetical protein n=1 Tax=Actinomadura sp. J1-007 TaxID=2661913 RepID=UPI0019D55AC0|nr:hypothetical protein [Actinomadura sp. J1-007]